MCSNMQDKPRSCWVVLDHRHVPNQLAELAGYYSLQEAEQEAAYIRKQRALPSDSEAIEVVEIPLQ